MLEAFLTQLTRAPIEVDSLVNPGWSLLGLMAICADDADLWTGFFENNDTYLSLTILGGGYPTGPVLG